MSLRSQADDVKAERHRHQGGEDLVQGLARTTVCGQIETVT